jgi:glycogen(starch) synthase
MAADAISSSRLPSRLLLTTDAVGGVWQYALDLASELSTRGCHVLLAVLGPAPSETQRRQLSRLSTVELAHEPFALEWMNDPWRDVDAAGDWLLRLQREFRADLVHLNGYSLAALPWQAPVVVAAHSCVFSWWRGVHNALPGPEWGEYKRRLSTGLAAATAVVAPSAFMVRSLEDLYGISPDNIRIIHNATRLLPPRQERKENFLLAAGRAWDPAKNFSVLDAAAASLDWPVYVAGNSRGPEQSAAPFRSLYLLNELSRRRLTERLRAASIFAHPALYEPFGLAVLEAARSGCALALSDIPSLRELWEGAALFINPRDPAAWQFELNALCSDTSRRARLSELASARSQHYSLSTFAAAYLDIYASLMTKHSRNGVAAA